MFFKYYLLAFLFAISVSALAGGADSTRNRDDAARAREAEAARQRAQQREQNRLQRERQQQQLNAGGHPTTGGLRKPKNRRDIEEIVRRAVDGYLANSPIYARGLYEDDGLYARDIYEDGLYARDADFDFEYDF